VSDFLAAVGLMLVFEGLVYGAFPWLAKRMAREVTAMPDTLLRNIGTAAIALGVLVVWLVRG
jgi:uncharacterized protein YjeT (DUF2065 family)